MTNQDPTQTNDLAQQIAAGLRDLAAFIESNPHLADGLRTSLVASGIKAHVGYGESNAATEQGEWARSAARHGATVAKSIDDEWHNIDIRFAGRLHVEVLAYRHEVCERVVTGVETVTKTVPDPEKLAAVPTVEVTETVETVEWICRPLLADHATGGVS